MRVMTTRATQLDFMKMHGLGNDFVVVDSRNRAPVTTPELARAIGDRNRGVGFDQLAELTASDEADFHLTFWNADGTQAGACGNATRCVAHHVMQTSGKDAVTIRTARGLLEARMTPEGPSVNMGKPQRDWRDIPLSKEADVTALPIEGAPVAVGMGNPHCVFITQDADAVDVAARGSAIEHHPLFPEATNVEFISLLGRDKLRMRVWERGTGITLACGSGACAALVAAHERGLTGPKAEIVLDGGTLTLEAREDGIWMTGPTAHVFDGTWRLT